MLRSINVGTAMTITQALEAVKRLKLKKVDNNRAFTEEYKKHGIQKLGISIDLERSLKNMDQETCQMNADVYAFMFSKNGTDMIDFKSIHRFLSDVSNMAGLNEPKYKIQNFRFINKIDSDLSSNYLELLKKASKPKGKTEKINKNDSGIEYSNDSRTVKVDTSKGGKITLTVGISNRKINSIIKSGNYALKSKSLDDLNNDIVNELESQIYGEYLCKLFGESDYYSQNEAEKIIKAGCKKIVTRENLISTLKGVSVYKGVDEYLSHVKDENKVYDFMEMINSESTAKKYLKELDSVYHINPVVISRRDAAKLKVSKLPSLVSLMGLSEFKPVVEKKDLFGYLFEEVELPTTVVPNEEVTVEEKTVDNDYDDYDGRPPF